MERKKRILNSNLQTPKHGSQYCSDYVNFSSKEASPANDSIRKMKKTGILSPIPQAAESLKKVAKQRASLLPPAY